MLTYRSEAVLSVEVALHSHRLTTFQEELNSTAFREPLDLLPSVLGDNLLCEVLYKLRITCLHGRAIMLRPINVGDFVLHRTEAVARAGGHSKLTANWEGPYKVTAHIWPGTYCLQSLAECPSLGHDTTTI